MARGASLTQIRGLIAETASSAVVPTLSLVETQEPDKGSTLTVAAPAGLSEAIQNVRTCVVQDGVLTLSNRLKRSAEPSIFRCL